MARSKDSARPHDVTRRRLLQTPWWAAWALLGGVLPRRTRAQPGGRGKVVVVGAGMAGLAAARELQDGGFEVKVLEGRDRIGGRIWSDRSLGVPIDLGATWIHGVRGNPITRLARRFAAETRPTHYDSLYLYDGDGSMVSDAVTRAYTREFESLLAEVGQLGQDISLAQGMGKVLQGETPTPQEERLLRWFQAGLEVTAGADLSELSLLADPQDQELSGGDALFLDGYDQIAKGLGAGLEVATGQEVKRIEWRRGGARVVTENAHFEGDAALVTLPLGVLKRGTVVFSPPLPDWKRQAIRRLGVGVLNKVGLRFAAPFWPTDRHFLGFVHDRRGHFPTFLNFYPYLSQPVLAAFVGGSPARTWEGRSQAETVTQILQLLRRVWGSSVPQPDRSVRTRWGRDPFAGGSYSHRPPGVPGSVYESMARPLGTSLLFAGEATNRQYPGTVHGAFLSGLREAKRLAEP